MPVTQDDKHHNTVSLYSKLYEDLRVIGNGTAIGLVGRWITWPSEKAYYEASAKTNRLSYARIYSNIFLNRKVLWELNHTFFKTGFTQTIGKSAANNGVICYVEYAYPNLTPMQSGLLTSAFSTPLETMATSYGEYKKVQAFFKIKNQSTMTTDNISAIRQVLTASSIRVGITSIITFCSIYQTADWLRQIMPAAPETMIKFTAALTASFAIQPLNMPFINYQTHVLINPYKHTALTFYQQHSLKEIMRGSLGRSINRSLYYGLTFFGNEIFKTKKISENTPSLLEEERQFKWGKN